MNRKKWAFFTTWQKNNRIAILLPVGLALLISAVHYMTFNQQAGGWRFLHIFLTKLYFLPVLLAAFWNGKRGAVLLSLIVSIIYLPHAILHLSGSAPKLFENISEIALLWTVGVIAGILSDRLIKTQNEKGRLTSLKEISGILDVVNHEIMVDYEACLGLGRALTTSESNSKGDTFSAQILLARLEHLGSHLGNLKDLAFPKKLNKKKSDIVKIIKQCIVEINSREHRIEVKYLFPNRLPHMDLDANKMTFAISRILQSLIHGVGSPGLLEIVFRKKSDKTCISFNLHNISSETGEKKKNHFDLFTRPEDNYALTLALSIIRSHGGTLEFTDKGQNVTSMQLYIPIHVAL
ncbi:MAG: hypothetical protein GWP06_05395 [Actinobacteria bacterium]|nr:hypothetical protein [Actinomycetota bacterium]